MSEYFRPSWDDLFMGIARLVATRSTCDRLRAGSVLVKDNRIIATGYNGSPPGLPHCDGEDGHLMENGHCVRTVHSELNAIVQIAKMQGTSTEGATLYITYSPCINCAKHIVATGIVRVVVAKIYRNEKVLDYLKDAGVRFDLLQNNPECDDAFKKLFETEVENKVAPEGEVHLATGK